MRVSLTALLLPCFFLCTANVRADLLIEVQDASIHAAGEGFVDVLITSDSDVLVSGFGLQFEITSGSGNHGTLSFKASPDTSYVTDPYYLLGNTGNLTLTPSGLGLTISDLDTIDHPLLTGVSRLLARLHVVHDLPSGGSAALAAADTFTISAVLANTEVSDETFALITPLSGLSGTVTISSAVPEPGPWLTCGVVALALLWRRRFGCRSATTRQLGSQQ
jgi:hypothetical protein